MKYILIAAMLLLSGQCFSSGNTSNESFNKAKKHLYKSVYNDHRETVYCGATFTRKKQIIIPQGFTVTKYKKRAARTEAEHVVPAENFGRTFSEWREGHTSCVDRKGKAFKGRNCASKANSEYRLMQADLYNLFPAIGAVNALRKNYNFVASVSGGSSFGSCPMKIKGRKAEPPASARGRIARTYLYMDAVYKRYKMGKPQRRLMTAWDKQYPVSQWECIRADRIKQIQGNTNPIMAARCGSN